MVNEKAHNCAVNFAKYLDEKYRNEYSNYSNKIIITKVKFYTDPKKPNTRYFLTAPSKKDEEKIHNILSKHHEFYTVRFREKNDKYDNY